VRVRWAFDRLHGGQPVKPMSREKHTGRKESGTFLRVPTAVLCSSNFCGMSLKAKALIVDIGARYNGHNNGDLAAPWTWMKERGWRSKDTLHRALKELRCAGMIELTRQGGLNGPSLYAFTWMPIDQCKAGLDVSPTRVASGKWSQPMTAPAEAKKTGLPPRPVGRTAPIIGQDEQKRESA
jgi:hypothetical protein